MRDIGKNIKQLRVQKNMTQDNLAEKLFVTRQTVSNYETGKSRPDVDMLAKISEVLGTDVQSVIYGTQPKVHSSDRKRLIIGLVLTGVFAILWAVLAPIAEEIQRSQFLISPGFFIYLVIKPLFCLFAGWTAAHLMGMALKKKPLQLKWSRRAGVILLLFLLIWIAVTFLYAGVYMLDEWLYVNHLRGEWEESWIETDGEPYLSKGWTRTPLPMVEWLGRITHFVVIAFSRAKISYHMTFILPGAALWLCGIPRYRKQTEI